MDNLLSRERIKLKEAIEQKLYEHLGFNDKDGTYFYNLTRVKQGFAVGTVSIEDFEEVNEEFVGDLADFVLTEIEQLREAQRWIPVSERLPESDRTVLVFAVNTLTQVSNFDFGWYDGDYQYWRPKGRFDDPLKITHWQPLPAPPTDETTS